ncbi:MAG: hypothetical protein GEV09_15875 [Pseudonocardiaceae bacterium]|nr:hypothetical protein [Pseudonocardiaceae bacterium]
MSESDPVAAVRSALAEMDGAYARAIGVIEESTDLDLAFAAANDLAAHMRSLDAAAGELRVRIVGQVWHSERLSLAALADRIGVSKSRADQLIRAVKKDQEQP